MRNILYRLGVPLLVAAAAGCVTMDEDSEKAVAALRIGQTEMALQWSEELARESHYTKRLGEVEAARVNMLLGRLSQAETWYRRAIDQAIDRKEAQPKIKLSDVGNEVLAGTVTDDRTREYVLSPYELNLALEYAILTQEALGKREDALVDARLAVYVQDNLAETYGADVTKAEASASATAKGICDDSMKSVTDLMAETRNSWENPVLWWLTGVLFEANGERDFALQSYRKAAAIRGDNPVFAADVARLEANKPIAETEGRVVFICGEGFVAGRHSLKVPVPLYTAMSIDIPFYRDASYTPRTVMIGETGLPASAASPAMNIQSLACRDLKDHLPGIVARNLTRAATAAAAQAAVNHAGNDYAKLAVLAANAAAMAFRRADTRCWRTLPLGEQVWSATVAPGTHEFNVSFGEKIQVVKLDLKPGETKILYVNGMEYKQ